MGGGRTFFLIQAWTSELVHVIGIRSSNGKGDGFGISTFNTIDELAHAFRVRTG